MVLLGWLQPLVFCAGLGFSLSFLLLVSLRVCMVLSLSVPLEGDHFLLIFRWLYLFVISWLFCFVLCTGIEVAADANECLPQQFVSGSLL